MNEYVDQANKFLNDTNTVLDVEFSDYAKHFPDDKEKRFVRNVSLKRGERIYTFKFVGSIQDVLNAVNKDFVSGRDRARTYKIKQFPLRTLWDEQQWESRIKILMQAPLKYIDRGLIKKPNAYDILACITKYDPGSFENFCGDFGYDTDSRTAERTYHAVKNAWLNIAALYNDTELDQLGEIN